MNRRNKENKSVTTIVLLAFILAVLLAHASVESSLMSLKLMLLGSTPPVFAVLGLAFAAFSFITDNPDAKRHLTYAVTGSVVLGEAGRSNQPKTKG